MGLWTGGKGLANLIPSALLCYFWILEKAASSLRREEVFTYLRRPHLLS